MSNFVKRLSFEHKFRKSCTPKKRTLSNFNDVSSDYDAFECVTIFECPTVNLFYTIWNYNPLEFYPTECFSPYCFDSIRHFEIRHFWGIFNNVNYIVIVQCL